MVDLSQWIGRLGNSEGLVLPLEDPVDLEELERFAKTFKLKRIQMGRETTVVYRGKGSLWNIFRIYSTRRGNGHGSSVQERLFSDHDFSIRSPEFEFQEYVQTQTSPSAMAPRHGGYCSKGKGKY